MQAQQLTIWSMALGAIACLGLARVGQFIRGVSVSQLQGFGYHATVFLLVLILSGVAADLAPGLPARAVWVAQVLAGPVCVGICDFWIGAWLDAPHRDRLMAGALRSAAVLLPSGGLAALALPVHLQLPAAAVLSLLGGTLTLWLTARAWLLGDRLAPLMTAGCLLTLPAIAGLYAIAMQVPGLDLRLHAAFALCAALSNGVTGVALWRRDRDAQRARRERVVVSAFDPVTRVRNGRSLVHKLLLAQRRRERSGREGGLLAVMVFNVDRLRVEAGSGGLNEVFIAIAHRLQRQVGAVNLVGRYYEGCFVALVESIPSPGWLRTLGLRVACNLRRPMLVTLRSGTRAEVAAEIGVGVVRLGRPPAAVEDILAEAQRMAVAARTLRSRAAIRDQRTGEPVAVEAAQLRGPRPRRADAMRTAS